MNHHPASPRFSLAPSPSFVTTCECDLASPALPQSSIGNDKFNIMPPKINATPAKRQISLLDSFHVVPSASGSNSAKKAKRSTTLTSLPFSRSTFIASLSSTSTSKGQASERDLLQLECETMEISWMRALQEDIRSPAFLELKRFLHGEKSKGVKVYPAGTC